MSKTRNEIRLEVLRIIREQRLIKENEEVPDTTRFIEDLNADSLDSAEIVMEIEDAFEGVKISD